MAKVTELAAIRAQIKAREEWYAAMQKRLHENEHNPAVKGIIENHLKELDGIKRRATFAAYLSRFADGLVKVLLTAVVALMLYGFFH